MLIKSRFLPLLFLAISLLVQRLAVGSAQAQSQALTFVLDTEPFRKTEAEAIAQDLRSIGANVEVRVWERTALLDRIRAGERNAYLTDWGSAYFDPFDLAIPKLRTKDRGNYSFYSNPELDRLLDLASTGTDQARRRDAYFRAQEILFRDAPWIFGYFKDELQAASRFIENWEPSMDSRINLHRVRITRGGVITVALNTNSIITLDPAMHRDRKTETVIRNIFDGLVTRTTKDRVVPELASGWQQTSPTTYEFKLLRGVVFHNGDPFTADDVVFTFTRVLREGAIAGQSSPRRGLLGPLQRVEKIDDYTVRFVLENPFPAFLQALVHFQIVPKRYIEQVGDKTFAERPVGTGPFQFVGGTLDSRIILQRFPRYYGGSPAIPPVGVAPAAGAIFRMIPEPSTRVAALKAGEVHIIEEVPVDLLPDLERDPNVYVKTTQGTRVYAVELNNARPPFNDPRVRRALNYAVNWDSILKAIYKGYAHRVATAFLPSGFGFNPNIRPYPYDPNRAKQLLREAGYIVR
jgi:peptide/nickel transport system substrate-binding protein